MNERQCGFTLIELVMVIIVLGILAAVAVPKFYQTSMERNQRAQVDIVNGIQSVYSKAAGESSHPPTLRELAERFDGGAVADGHGVQAANSGIRVSVNGHALVLKTFQDVHCSPGQVTTAPEQSVLCMDTALVAD